MNLVDAASGVLKEIIPPLAQSGLF